MIVALEGGPYDGAEVERSAKPGSYVWVQASSGGYTFHRDYKDGTALYRRTGRTSGLVHGTREEKDAAIMVYYVFVGYDLTRCKECRFFVPQKTRCRVCGNVLFDG